MEPIKWPNQFAHLLFSTAVMLGRVVWFPKNLNVTLGLAFGLIAYAAIKEFVWDVHFEKSQDNTDAAVDAAFYTLGAVATLFALLFTGKV
jgi:hypothetical protein